MKSEESLVAKIVDNYMVEIKKENNEFVSDAPRFFSEFQHIRDILLCNALNENYLNRLISLEIREDFMSECSKLRFSQKILLAQKINIALNPLNSTELKNSLIEINCLCSEIRNNLLKIIPFADLLNSTRSFTDYLRATMSVGIDSDLQEEERCTIDVKFITNFFIKAVEVCLKG